jgi:hypothetical protein
MLFSPERSEDDELQRYLAEKADVNARPLEWWCQNAEKFPKIAHIARRVLAVPATSVPSERVFSSAGLVVSKLRNRLTSDLVDTIIFLNKNCKSMPIADDGDD